MAKTKISEFSPTPANNTDIDNINIAEGCAPSGINDAIRELMAQLKDFQAGTAGDSFNGPIGTTTAVTGAFTNVTASGTLGVTGVATLGNGAVLGTPASVTLTNGTGLPIASGVSGLGTGVATALAVNVGSAGAPVLFNGALGTPSSGTVTNLTGTASININGTVGATTASTGAFTTLAASGAVTLSGGTANGVAYLNGSKVLTTGSALTFDGTNLIQATGGSASVFRTGSAISSGRAATFSLGNNAGVARATIALDAGTELMTIGSEGNFPVMFQVNGSEVGRFTSTGLGIGTSSPGAKLEVASSGSASTVILRNTSSSSSTYSEILFAPFTGTTAAAASIRNIFSGNNASLLTFATTNTDAVPQERMRLDNLGNVGIGTSSPSQKLEVNGNALISVGAGNPYLEIKTAGAGNNPYLKLTADTNYWEFLGAFSQTNDNLLTRYNGTALLDLDKNGNLGLGVTPSAWGSGRTALQVGGSTTSNIVGTSPNTLFGSNFYFDGTNNRYVNTGFAANYVQSAGQHYWSIAPSGTAGDAISFTQAMSLTAGGDLVVGGTTAFAKMHGIASSEGNTTYALMTDNAAAGAGVNVAGLAFANGGNIKSSITSAVYGNDYMAFNVGTNTERARIDSSGNLLVGRTSQFGSERVSIESGSSNPVITTYNFAATAVTHHEIRNQNGIVGSIVASAGSTTYNTSSDYRLKNITGPITTSGAYIDSLNPVEGTWKADGSTFVGLIAHEVQEASRTTVATGVKDGEQMQGMDYSSAEIIANLIAEVKSLRQRLAAAGI